MWVFIVLLEKEIIKFIEYEIIPLIYTYGEYKKILAFGIDLDIWDAIVIISSAILIVGIVLIGEIFYMKKFNKQ